MRSMELHPSEAEHALAGLPGSPVQRYLHNELLGRLDGLRNQIETVTPEELKSLQGSIAEVRRLLGIIHKRDSESLKKTYA